MRKDKIEIKQLNLLDLQPSQFYISQEKMERIERWFDSGDLSAFQPIPVKILDGRPVMTDGHTRAVVALQAGITNVPLRWDEDDLDWEMYRACVVACNERGIHSPADLMGRVVDAVAYQQKWELWCDRMQADVMARRLSPEIDD